MSMPIRWRSAMCLQIFVIGAQRLLRVRTVIAVLEEHLRHAPLRQRTKVVDRSEFAQRRRVSSVRRVHSKNASKKVD